MRKKVLMSVLFTVLIGWLIAALIIFRPAQPPDVGISDTVWNSYHSTCRITMNHSSGKFTGTGVTLHTGYILTAAHIIDVNNNKKLDLDEHNLDVEFFGAVADIQSATVVFCGDYEGYDIAVLQVQKPPKTNIHLVDIDFGERVFTIGCTKGADPNISEGVASSNHDGLARAGMAVWRGNSGGGIWTQGEGLAGIVTRLGLGSMRSNIRLMIPTNGGMMMIRVRHNTRFPLANWCEYIPAVDIRDVLDDKGLGFVYDIHDEPIHINPYYFLMFFEIFGVLICGWYFKKHLMG